MVKVGDILVHSFGYNCTLVDFYKIVNVTKSGKSIKIRKLNSKMTSHDGYGQAGKVVPDETFSNNEILTKRIVPSEYFGYMIKINDYSHAYPWDGKEVSFNSYD